MIARRLLSAQRGKILLNELLSSTKNQRIKDIKKLMLRKHREATGLCFVDGVQPVLRALDNNLDVESLIIAPDMLKSELAWRRIRKEEERGTKCLYVTSEVYDYLSERDNPVGLAIVVRQRWQELDRIEVKPSGLFVALHDIKGPGNLGTIIRTADAFSVDAVILIGNTADPYDSACVKASMGTTFNVPLVKESDCEKFLQWSATRGLVLFTTSAHASHTLDFAPWRFPAAVLFGSEAQGLPEELLRAGTVGISIPMAGQASSLNLAVAAGIILYAAREHR